MKKLLGLLALIAVVGAAVAAFRRDDLKSDAERASNAALKAATAARDKVGLAQSAADDAADAAGDAVSTAADAAGDAADAAADELESATDPS